MFLMTEQNGPVPGSPEYDAKMIALAESTGSRIRVGSATSGTSEVIVAGSDSDPSKQSAPANATAAVDTSTPAAAQRPANVPEKFWNAEKGEINTEALLKSYSELESGKSKPDLVTPGQPTTKPSAVPASAEPTEAQKAAQIEYDSATTDEARAVAQAKLDAANAAANPTAPTATLQSAMERAAADFSQTGELTEESFVQLEAAGITREYATAYVEGLKARAEVVTMKVFNEAGGQDQYTAMSAWAKSNWSTEQINAHNRAVQSGDLNATLGAIRTMKAAYGAAQGTDATTRVEPKGGANNATPSEGYKSKEEFQKDIADPRYQKGDRAFHAQVDRKLEAAMRAGVDIGF